MPVATQSWTVAQFFAYWRDITVKVKRPATYQGDEGIARRYIIPALGRSKLERLTVHDVRSMLTRLQHECRCCRDGIDAAVRPRRGSAARSEHAAARPCRFRSIQYVHAVPSSRSSTRWARTCSCAKSPSSSRSRPPVPGGAAAHRDANRGARASSDLNVARRATLSHDGGVVVGRRGRRSHPRPVQTLSRRG